VATEAKLPQWAMGIQEGMISQWLKAVGDPVEVGEPIAEAEESKVSDVIHAPVAGYLIKILVQEGQTVPVRTPLCLIGTQDELHAQIEQAQAEQAVAQPIAESSAPEGKQRAKPDVAVQVTPIARKLANEYKLDLSTIQGSGPGGRITEDDVRKAYQRMSVPKEYEIQFSGMRETVAQRMSASLRNAAQFTLTMRADVTELHKQREELKKADMAFQATLTDVIIKAVALMLAKHQRLNGWVETEKIRLPPEIHIGLAVALEEGLIVPVLRNMESKSLGEIATENKVLAVKARNKTLTAEEISGSTFSITNLGMFGVDFFTPIINPPEIAILGVGAVSEYPLRQDEHVDWRKSLPLSLTIDHRAVDGAPAAEFLRDLKDCLEHIDLKTL
jgi:pyruvate dehydrogenase E2 component (dihydrolipoamide acetyltransferase)